MTPDELKARGLRVKPLEWEDHGYTWAWWADAYRIRYECGAYHLDRDGETIFTEVSLERAKAAAEADQAARISAQLEVDG